MRLLFTLLILAVTLSLPAQRTSLLDKNGDRIRGTPLALGRNNAPGYLTPFVKNMLTPFRAV